MLITAFEPKKVPMTPDPDGVRTAFFIPEAYKPNTVSVWVNGLRIIPEDADGFTLPGGAEIQMKIAPAPGDSLQAMFEAA